jgi:ribosomal protein S12 methylthiotransferase accessory factor YcaO
MVSLASLRYSDVFAENGGPIASIVTGDLSVFGETYSQANAFLRPELSAGKPAPAIYGMADGSGSDPSAAVACHMAISEALERWAFLAVQDGARASDYGFDVDASSNGMATFPGFFRRQAQNLARMEALERFAIISWWDGRLPAERISSPIPGVELIRIHHDAGPGEVVIMVRHTRAGQAYGHAAGPNVAEAVRKAMIELARAEYVLTTHRAKGSIVAPADFFERRVLWFAGDEGAEAFRRRLHSRPDKATAEWKPVFDDEIPGPWSHWATVWRCCVAMPTDAFLEPRTNFFFW